MKYEWQPIETAPKDGTDVLTWDGKNMFISHYYRSNWLVVGVRDDCHFTDPDPTHWTPLPEPPK